MRTLHLLEALTKKELQLIEEKILAGKRKGLLPLFKHLKKYRLNDVKPDRADLYKRAFGSAYSKNKDYLLRNELRLLNEIIYEFLVMDCFKEHISKNKNLFNRWLAQSYYNRKMPVFAEDVDGFIDAAQKDVQTEEATAMFALRSTFSGTFPMGGQQVILKQLAQWKEEEKRRFLHRLRKIEYSIEFFENNVGARNPIAPSGPEDWTSAGDTVIDFADTEKNDWYARYLTLQKFYWQSKGDTQRKYLKEIIEISSADIARNTIKIETHITNLEAMAFSLVMSCKHEEANDYMEQPLKLAEKNNLVVSPTHIIIYMINLVVTGQYEPAIKLYSRYQKIVDKSIARGHAIMLSAYSYLFLNKPDEALNMIKAEPKLAPNELLHIRYVYMIAFILRRQYDLAESEVKNLKRMLTNAALSNLENDLEVAGYFQTYIRALQAQKSQQKQTLEKLKAEVLENFARHKPLPHHNLQLNWLDKLLKESN